MYIQHQKSGSYIGKEKGTASNYPYTQIWRAVCEGWISTHKTHLSGDCISVPIFIFT